MIIAFAGPPPAYRPGKPERPEQPKRPEYTRISRNVPMNFGTFIEQAGFAAWLIGIIFALIIFGAFAGVYHLIHAVVSFVFQNVPLS